MNHDGRPDIITAEHRGTKKLSIWENVGDGFKLIEHIISTGRENHLGAQVAGMDGDGDLSPRDDSLHARRHRPDDFPGASCRAVDTLVRWSLARRRVHQRYTRRRMPLTDANKTT